MNNKAHLRPKDYDRNGDIIPDSVKEDKGDTISRSALIQHAFTAEFDGKSIDVVALFDVDNAPTVEMNEMTQELINKIMTNIGCAKPIDNKENKNEKV